MSSYFGNYDKNRHGFQKLYRDLSDETWNNGIELIKLIGKRGGMHDFSQRKVKLNSTFIELNELESLTKAVDIQKEFFDDANQIHEVVTHKDHRIKNDVDKHVHDADIAHTMEEEFAEKQSEQIRKLVGYVHDLSKMMEGSEKALSVYLFDEYLQKA